MFAHCMPRSRRLVVHVLLALASAVLLLAAAATAEFVAMNA